ncbi:hypothetical protein D0Z08_29270 [Nocardioides immobilis]|uniref:O-antigen ligase domain-containing protein n=1 Tax=Nocardioides immobilis TaxID=2049295 RepID=A0A417XSR3_9ACTN|nr:hypothetical protein [Nocardioides immobilis]RHW23508.1 hypothetical protein D0Z08_29270 [Nocardioides immobilis]
MGNDHQLLRSIAVWSIPIVLAVLLPYTLIVTADGSIAALVVVAGALVVGMLTAAFGVARTGSGVLILAFATVPWNDVVPISQFGFLELSDALFVTGFLLILTRFASLDLRLPALFTVGAFVFMAAGTLSAIVQPAPRVELGYLLDAVQGVILLMVLVTWWRASSRTVVAAAGAYIIGNAISVAAGIREGADTAGRYDGLTTHPNALGTCSALSIALLPFLWQTVSRQHRWLLIIGAVVSGYGIWLSGSRAALVCVAILTVLYPLFDRSTRAALAVAALGVPTMILVARAAEDPDESSALGRLLGGGRSEDATQERIEGSRELIVRILDNPIFGAGWADVWQAHNIYLQTAAAIGLVGAVGLLIILTAILRPLLTVPAPYRWLAYPALAAALIGTVDPAFGGRYIWAPIALALCAERLAAATGPRGEPGRHPGDEELGSAMGADRITP